MRVTSKMMQNTYLKNVNALTTGTQSSLNQLSSGMKLFRASENTAAAVKAYQVRTSLNRNVGYTSNLEHADAVLTSSESVLMGIEGILKEAKGRIIQALNGTNNESNRATIASELASIQDQILQAMNSNDSGFYVFGGSNTDVKPFGVGEGGKLVYNNQILADLPSDSKDAAVRSFTEDTLHLDIGLESEFDADGNIIKSTVFDYSISGISVMGYGSEDLFDKNGNALMKQALNTDGTPMVDPVTGDPVMVADNVSSNLYDILGELVNEFNKADGTYSVDRADSLYGVFEKAVDTVTTQLTNIGAKTAYIEYSKDRIGTLDMNLTEKQAAIEDVDYAEAYTTYTSLYTSYQAALQVGSKIIGPSLFDYL